MKDLIKRILTNDISKRLDTLDMLSHEWNSRYTSITPAPIFAEAKHTIERCFNPPMAAHIWTAMDAAPASKKPARMQRQHTAGLSMAGRRAVIRYPHYPYANVDV